MRAVAAPAEVFHKWYICSATVAVVGLQGLDVCLWLPVASDGVQSCEPQATGQQAAAVSELSPATTGRSEGVLVPSEPTLSVRFREGGGSGCLGGPSSGSAVGQEGVG